MGDIHVGDIQNQRLNTSIQFVKETSLAFTNLKRPMLSKTQGNILQFGIVYRTFDTEL